MGAWEAVQYVGSGLSLVAFSIAAILFAYRARLNQRADAIRSTSVKDRLKALAITAQFFQVDTKKLSPKQQEDIILAQIKMRARRDLISATAAMFVALILASVAVTAIYYSNVKDRESTASQSTDSNISTPHTAEAGKLECQGTGSWPVGIWNVRLVHFEGADDQKSVSYIRLIDQSNGTWLGGSNLENGQYKQTAWEKFTVSEPIRPSGQTTMRFTALNGRFLSENRLSVSPDGCSMSGDVEATLDDKPFVNGRVEFCWSDGPNCAAGGGVHAP